MPSMHGHERRTVSVFSTRTRPSPSRRAEEAICAIAIGSSFIAGATAAGAFPTTGSSEDRVHIDANDPPATWVRSLSAPRTIGRTISEGPWGQSAGKKCELGLVWSRRRRSPIVQSRRR